MEDLVLRTGTGPGVVVVASAPTGPDIVAGRALSGHSGPFWRSVLSGAGEDLIGFRYLIRCRPARLKEAPARTVSLARGACNKWNRLPEEGAYYVSLDLATALRESAFMSLLSEDASRAARISREHGLVVALLLGEEVFRHYAPWVSEGSMRDWRGHWWLAPGTQGVTGRAGA